MEVKVYSSPSRCWDGFSWKRVLVGLRKPAIALIGMGLSALAVKPQWAWVGGLSAAAIWGTVEYYLRAI